VLSIPQLIALLNISIFADTKNLFPATTDVVLNKAKTMLLRKIPTTPAPSPTDPQGKKLDSATTQEAAKNIVTINWDEYSNALYTTLISSEQGGLQKFTTDLAKANNKLTTEALINFGWHFDETSLSLVQKAQLETVKKQSFTTLLKLMANDLSYLPSDKCDKLATKLLDLEQSLAFMRDEPMGAEKNDCYAVIKTYQAMQVSVQQSFLFALENSRDLITFLSEKIELIRYFITATATGTKALNNKTLLEQNEDDSYKNFAIQNKLFESLWRLQTLGKLLMTLSQNSNEEVFLQNLSDDNLDILIKNVTDGILSIVPDEKIFKAPAEKVKLPEIHQASLTFLIKAVWSGLRVKNAINSSDPRFVDGKPIYAKDFLAGLVKRLDIANKNNLKNYSRFNTKLGMIKALLEKYALLDPLPILNIAVIARPTITVQEEESDIQPDSPENTEVTDDEQSKAAADPSAASDTESASEGQTNTTTTLASVDNYINEPAPDSNDKKTTATIVNNKPTTNPKGSSKLSGSAKTSINSTAINSVSEMGAYYGTMDK
jgi:hypothetical protein